VDEEVDISFELRPARYSKWHVIGMGLNFTADVFEGASNLFNGFTMMTAQYCMQLDIDDRFKEIINGS
jgi:hypothetical protein